MFGVSVGELAVLALAIAGGFVLMAPISSFVAGYGAKLAHATPRRGGAWRSPSGCSSPPCRCGSS